MPTPDAPTPLAHLRAQLTAPRGRARVEALLERPDAADAVAALAPNALHELVTAVGMADAGELLALATPEQVQGCLDLEVWDRDRIELSQARPWVATLLELGFEKVGQVWAGLDAEWRALYLQGHTVIYDLTGGEDPDHDIDYVEDPDAPPVWFSPDGAFAVRLLHGEDPARLTMALLDDLYRADLGLARHTLLAARSEPTAELEEQSYRWRSGRLADLGYVDFYDALALFAPLTVEQYAAEPTAPATPLEVDAAPLPVVVAEALLGKSFLARAWDRAVTEAPAAHERLQHALVTLVNTVLAAARVRPGDSSALGAAATYATATLSLGLESVSRGDLARAAALLPDASLNRLHRVGFTATARLAKVGAALAPRATTADDTARAVLDALAAPRPHLARAVDDPPGVGARPFEALIDLRRVAEVLAELAVRIAIAERLGVALIAGTDVAERPALDAHVRTALTRWLAGGALDARALSAAELKAARAALGGAVDRAAAVAAVRAVVGEDGGLSPKLAALVDGWLDEIADTLLALDPDAAIDPRFIDGLLVAAPIRA
ncbi:MAG: hypothetical protein IPH80_25075 [Myxococcales bacterium]|nr:hypothetical protein [Myxococcales bacterium]MBP6844245.1 hypothetical protein [Kofleriaceae bacterium]